jgi:hypothetical protein
VGRLLIDTYGGSKGCGKKKDDGDAKFLRNVRSYKSHMA